jgi:hypothetical protein
MRKQNTVYTFRFAVSGSGEIINLGVGTLHQGTNLIRKFDRLFELATEGKDGWDLSRFSKEEAHILQNWEGCDVYAELDGAMKFIYIDRWERWE